MISVGWLPFRKMIEFMETKFDGRMTFRQAVFMTGLPRHYKGSKYVPEFYRHKLKAILPDGEEEQIYIIRRDNGTVESSQH
jgi:hypothetical protein